MNHLPVAPISRERSRSPSVRVDQSSVGRCSNDVATTTTAAAAVASPKTPEPDRRQRLAAKLSFKKEFLNLMNDWELGGTQNSWVMPSDRHLQLRAHFRLKSGWSVRTATARSPTNPRQSIVSGISDSEQEHIRKVLERAEAGRQNEQMRIGKMVDRLDKLRKRAVGNGVTQCLLCQTEFGLLASKSYAAMCLDCRKYVCQRNCGVETFDKKRGEQIFLCKLCSEQREVMWKKSGAWFYREMPTYVRPADAAAWAAGSSSLTNLVNGTPIIPPQQQQESSTDGGRLDALTPSPVLRTTRGSTVSPNQLAIFGRISLYDGEREDRPAGAASEQDFGSTPGSSRALQQQQQQQAPRHSPALSARTLSSTSASRRLPIPQDQQQQRLRTTPRPRITPSWVHDNVRSSMSIGSEEEIEGEESSSSSVDPADFRHRQQQHNRGYHQTAPVSSTQQHPMNTYHQAGPLTGSSGATSHRRHHHYHHGPHTATRARAKASGGSTPKAGENLQRIALGSRGRIMDTDESENDESRRTTPSTSPRHSIATPSSYGGDDYLTPSNQGTQAGAAHEHNTMSDTRSVDSGGIVQSDHSAQQQVMQLTALSTGNQPPFLPQQGGTQYTVPHPPLTIGRKGSGSLNSSMNALMIQSHSPHQLQEVAEETPAASGHSTSSPVPPPIPPRTSQGGSPIPSRGGSQSSHNRSQLSELGQRRPSSTSSASSSALGAAVGGGKRGENLQMTHIAAAAMIQQRHAIAGGGPSLTDSVHSSSADLQLMGLDFLFGTHPQNAGKVVCPEGTAPPATSVNQAVPTTSDNKKVGATSSPVAASSPEEDDSSTLGSVEFDLTYLPEEKQLVIHLIRAKNLRAMDKNGFSDPYVKFHLIPGNAKATKLTSSTIERTLNPEWNEEMAYHGITEEDRQRKTLRMTVLDRDRIGADFLGEARIPLKKISPGVTKKFNIYLEHAMPLPAMEKADVTERGKILISTQYNIQQGCLLVGIKRCAELLGMDSTGFSDPYCRVSLTPLASKAHRQRTSIKKRSLNPEFNEILQFIVPFKDLPKKALEVCVLDHDVGKQDDYIGGIVLSCSALAERGKQWQSTIENPGKTFENWHKLTVD